MAIATILNLQKKESGTQAPLEGGSMTLGADFVKPSARATSPPHRALTQR
ncbi:MAG: hypothetical protein H0W65_10265 [Sphingomonas sp.]|nr:hypothetical protein [Sphingomonas sp.]MBA3668086.1 hypothetical protein [Sphingomonas sp.]